MCADLPDQNEVNAGHSQGSGHESKVGRHNVQEGVGEDSDAEERKTAEVAGEGREGEEHGDDLDQSLSGEDAANGACWQVESASELEGKRGSGVGFRQTEQDRKKLLSRNGVANEGQYSFCWKCIMVDLLCQNTVAHNDEVDLLGESIGKAGIAFRDFSLVCECLRVDALDGH